MKVYLDHNSTTPLRPEAREVWLRVSDEVGANPSSLHGSGRRARAWIDESRERVAAALQAHEDEIFFTSGATEANNLALFGSLERPGARSALVVAATEHSSVLEPARELASRGHRLELVAVDAAGRVDPRLVGEAASKEDVELIAVAAANNETGTIAELAVIAGELGVRGPRPRLHIDVVQALGRIALDLGAWGADLAAISAHKVGGPPGVGVLWRRRGLALQPRCFGGGQELDLRPGTENVPGIAAAALAIELAVAERAEFAARTRELSTWLWRELSSSLPELRLLGPPLASASRLPNTLCVLVPGTDGKVLVTRLDLAGLEVSAGSACASGSVEPSHVLLAMGLSRDEARAALRLSLGRSTTREDCTRALSALHNTLASSRAT